MDIFIIYINVTKPLSHFDCVNFKVSLVIETINFNGILKMAHLTMLVIFHVNVITCQIFNSSHIYHIFAEKTHFFIWKFSNWTHGIQTWFKLCEMTWFNMFSTFIQITNYLKKIGVYLCFWVHRYTTFVSTNILQSPIL